MLKNDSPLAGIKVLDVSRILAGPACTQLLGDYGAEVLKVEKPDGGDDTRKWGPPYVVDDSGRQSTECAYFLSTNRNKRSITIDMSSTEGQRLIEGLAAKSDVFIENFKVGGVKRFNLDYNSLQKVNPGLIYCSITGFGQYGPNAHRAGYDFMIQAMGGIMSLTGPVQGEPCKVGVAIADMMCGMYACTAILSALHHRHLTGEGQYIDVALFDAQVAWLANSAQNYLTSGELPKRYGNAHPNVVPYEIFPSSDGYFSLAVGNDGQFQKFCALIGEPALHQDQRFTTNESRVVNRDKLIPILRQALVLQPTSHWLNLFEQNGIPASPVNDIKQVFDDPQIAARDMRINMPHPDAGEKGIDLIGNPVKFSKTPVSYRRPPPKLGQHTQEILKEYLNLDQSTLDAYQEQGVI